MSWSSFMRKHTILVSATSMAARVTLWRAALVIFFITMASVDAIPPSTDHGIMSIKNDLPFPLTIICSSNKENRAPFNAHPGGSLQFDFDTTKHLAWTCAFQSEGPDGTFVLWKSKAAGGPGNLCVEVCQWRADLQGLKVLRNGTGQTVLVYLWH